MNNQLHYAMKRILANIKILKLAALAARRDKAYSEWSHWMNQIKKSRAHLRIVAHWVHVILHGRGLTAVRPTDSVSLGNTTVAGVMSIVARYS